MEMMTFYLHWAVRKFWTSHSYAVWMTSCYRIRKKDEQFVSSQPKGWALSINQLHFFRWFVTGKLVGRHVPGVFRWQFGLQTDSQEICRKTLNWAIEYNQIQRKNWSKNWRIQGLVMFVEQKLFLKVHLSTCNTCHHFMTKKHLHTCCFVESNSSEIQQIWVWRWVSLLSSDPSIWAQQATGRRPREQKPTVISIWSGRHKTKERFHEKN